MAFERLRRKWRIADLWVRKNQSEAGVFALAHFVFLIAAVTFTWMFWEHEKTVSLVRYLGAGVTLWASLHGLYHFMLTQAPTARRWFRGLTVVFHGLNVLLCLGLMASHRSVLVHGLVIHIILTLYIIWDVIAQTHHRPRSGRWFAYYEELQSHDLRFWILYGLCAYLGHFPEARAFLGFASVPVDVLSDWLTFFVLVSESIEFVGLSLHSTINTQNGGTLLDVDKGYEVWAPLYEKGNGIISVEREHTVSRLPSLSIQGKTIVDFGCGTGYYLKAFLDGGAVHVIGIECNEEMRRRIPDTTSSDARCELRMGGVATLGLMDRHSVDGVFCALVVDHLRDFDYRDFLRLSAQVLKPGGWLYISDVNPYFELREHCYANFWDQYGVETRIKVFPHSIAFTMESLRKVGFSQIELREGRISDSVASKWEELTDLTGFPLIIEYLAS